MRCSLSTPLTDDQISALLDGDAEQPVQAHLEHCPACAARLQAAKEIEQTLHHRLHRFDCPPSQQLGDYHLGLVDRALDRSIMLHLEQCSLCKAEIEELRLFLAAAEPSKIRMVAGPVLQPRRPTFGELIARLLPRTAPLTMRGVAPTTTTAEAGSATIVLDTQPTTAGRITLQGQVLDDQQERWVGALVELRQSGVLQATATLDDLGGFQCGPLKPDPLELRLTPRQGRPIRVPEVEVR